MIKAVFFDFDGVLTTDGNGSGTTCRNIQKAVPDLAFENIYRCYRVHHSVLLTGKKNHADIWKDFCSCVGKEVDIGVLHNAFKNTPKNEQMFQLSKMLREKYTTGIIADNTKERFDVLRVEMQLPIFFDAVIVSGDIGYTKHERAIFEEALQSVHCQADECVFIDNHQKNLEIPSAMGFHTFWHDHEKNDLAPLLQQLKAWGVEVDSL